MFSAHTINCVCHSIRSMFRVLGIYNFVGRIDRLNPYDVVPSVNTNLDNSSELNPMISGTLSRFSV